MLFSNYELGDLDTGKLTTLDLFEMQHKLIIVTIKVRCPKCGHAWGIKCEEFDNLAQIPKSRFICTECLEQ